MYGIVNKAIKGLIIDEFGKSTWTKVKEEANLDVEVFQSTQDYDDGITYDLVNVSSRILNIPKEELFFKYGKYWIVKVATEKYGSIINASAHDFEHFISDIPNFHTRLLLLYPDIEAPEIEVIMGDKKILFEYHSDRIDFSSFILGALHGIGELFKKGLTVNLTECSKRKKLLTFEITWM